MADKQTVSDLQKKIEDVIKEYQKLYDGEITHAEYIGVLEAIKMNYYLKRRK